MRNITLKLFQNNFISHVTTAFLSHFIENNFRLPSGKAGIAFSGMCLSVCATAENPLIRN